MKGLFISLEGNEGAGKTTAAYTLKKELEERGYPVLYTREPGGSQIAEQIRDVLLDFSNTNMDPKTEAILYAASRRQHLSEILKPALEKGTIILCDRFIDSSLVYQGIARNLGIEEVEALNMYATDNLWPDLTLLLLVDVETGLKRVQKRGEINRMDQESLAFHKDVKKGYELLAKRYPERIRTIDANKNQDETAEECLKIILDKLNHDQ